MAYTSYITIDGMLIGEATNGVMRNYRTDALGSVVTTSLNGVAENTYRYKPYGGLLAKTGTAADPSFLWNGGSGYRATTLPSTTHYVRRRHLSNVTASWTTVDPLWPSQPCYGYVRGAPVRRVDPSGLQCEITDFTVTPGTPQCGYIISNGTLFLSVYKPVTMGCGAQCSIPDTCSLTQGYYNYETMVVGLKPQQVLVNTGGYLEDGQIECDKQVGWADYIYTWILSGFDAPGYWQINSPVNRFSQCLPPSGPSYKLFRGLIPDVKVNVNFIMKYHTFCGCKLQDPISSVIDWSFTWGFNYVYTSSLNYSFTWTGECAS